MPVAVMKEGVKYFLAYDQVGSLRVVSDSGGNVVKAMEYDSFGNILTDSAPAFSVPFGFAGGLHDRDTGLVRFGYRDYDPDVGRWTAKNPIFFDGGDTDLYGYVLNDPVNAIDPIGLEFSSGVAVNISIIKPMTSERGGVWGYNIQSFYDGETYVHYSYEGKGNGIDVGAAIESVWAWGSGPWSGDFRSVNVSFKWFTASYFWTPGKGGWSGFTFGFSAGLPGIAYEETKYKKVFNEEAAENPCN